MSAREFEKLCPVIVENTLKRNLYSITDTAHELMIRCDELHDFLEQYGISKGPTPKEFVADPVKDLEKSLKMLEDLIQYCSEYGDFRNGNTCNGIDEGAVEYSNTVYILQRKIANLRNRNNL